MTIASNQIVQFTNGTIADATQVDANFNVIVNEINSHEANTNNPHNTTAAQVGAITGINNVTNPGGTIQLAAGSNITITNDNTNKVVTVAQNNNFSTDINMQGNSINAPALGIPTGVTATVGTSGTVGPNLAASTTYSYTVTAIASDGVETSASSAASATTGATPYPITISWTAVPNAAKYNVYRGNGLLFSNVTGTSVVDSGSAAPSSTAPPVSNNTGTITANRIVASYVAGASLLLNPLSWIG